MKRIIFLLALMLTVTACGQSAGRLNNKGNRAFADRDYAAALEAYQSAQAQAPDVAEPYYNAANAYYRQENYRQAALQAEQSLRTADDALSEYGYYNLGNIYFQNRQFEQAVEAYKQALRLNPNDTDAKHNLELALQQLEKQNEQQKQQQNQQDGNNGQQPPSTPTPSPTPTPSTGGTPEAQKTPSAQPTPGSSGQGQQNDTQPQQGQAQPSKPQQLTTDQARRLLESIAGDTKTLQEKLMELYGTPPAENSGGEDW